MVIPRFVTQALKNDPLTVYGDGRQTRTFTYVRDVVRTLMVLIEKEEALGEVFNVGGIDEISMMDLAKKIIEKTESESSITMIPYEEAFGRDFEDMQRRVPGIEKIENLVGFKPETDLDTILQHTIDYMRMV